MEFHGGGLFWKTLLASYALNPEFQQTAIFYQNRTHQIFEQRTQFGNSRLILIHYLNTTTTATIIVKHHLNFRKSRKLQNLFILVRKF